MRVSPNTIDPIQKHRREVWLKIVTPVALGFLGLIVLSVVLVIAVATDAMVSKQITVMMSILATVFVILPLAIVCLLPYLLLALGAYGAGQLYAHVRTPVRFTRRLTEQVAVKTQRLAPRIARPFMGLNVRTTRWEHRLRGWNRPALPAGKEQTHE